MQFEIACLFYSDTTQFGKRLEHAVPVWNSAAKALDKGPSHNGSRKKNAWISFFASTGGRWQNPGDLIEGQSSHELEPDKFWPWRKTFTVMSRTYSGATPNGFILERGCVKTCLCGIEVFSFCGWFSVMHCHQHFPVGGVIYQDKHMAKYIKVIQSASCFPTLFLGQWPISRCNEEG